MSAKSIYFVTDTASNVALEASHFCSAHLPGMPSDECVSSLVTQVETVRGLRQRTQTDLPGITFTVRNAEGIEVRFVHEAGQNPRDESQLFCMEHFAKVPIDECIEAVRRSGSIRTIETSAHVPMPQMAR